MSCAITLDIIPGVPGVAGPRGWTPTLAIETDGARRILRIVGWTGGAGEMPPTGYYVGSSGLVNTSESAVDIRGPENDDAVVAAAAAQAAAEAAEAAAEDAEAAVASIVAGVTLPIAVASTYLRQKSDLSGYETLTADELRDDIDLLRDFNDDGSTDDTANFTALRADPRWATAKIDLRGGVYKVDAIPSGPFVERSGFFKVGNYLYPVGSLIDLQYVVTSETSLAHWAQDQAHHYAGVRYCGYGQGSAHAATDNIAKLAASYSRGLTWQASTMFSDATYSSWVASMGVLWGRQFAIVRRMDGSENVIDQKLYSRHLYEEFVLSTPFNTTSGSAVVTLVFTRNHGLITGDTINITQAGDPSGVVLSGDYSVTKVNSTQVTVTGTGNASATATGVGGSAVRIYIKESSSWTEHTFSGSSFGAAVQSASGGTGQPAAVQSFAGFANDRAFVCVSGNGQFGIVRISGIFSHTTATLTYTAFTDSTSQTESTVCANAPDTTATHIYGMSRPQTTGVNRFFWWATTLTGTLSKTESSFGFNFGTLNPAPIRYHAATDRLYSVTAERLVSGQGEQLLDVYLMVADATEARTLGASAFKIIKDKSMRIQSIGTGYFGSGAPYAAINTGTPSLDIEGDTLIVYITQEEGRVSSGVGIQASNIKAVEIDISANSIQATI